MITLISRDLIWRLNLLIERIEVMTTKQRVTKNKSLLA